MCLDEMEEFKGRDIAFVSDWLTKKVFKRSLLKTGGAENDCFLVGVLKFQVDWCITLFSWSVL